MINWNKLGGIDLGRKYMVDYAMHWIGTPYHWGTEHGGDDFMGMDCSGFLKVCTESVGLTPLGLRLTADGWFRYFKNRLCLFGNSPSKGWIQFHTDRAGKAYHVMLCVDRILVIGASGGTSKVLDDDDAAIKNAFVKILPYNYVSETKNRKIIYCDPFSQVQESEQKGG